MKKLFFLIAVLVIPACADRQLKQTYANIQTSLNKTRDTCGIYDYELREAAQLNATETRRFLMEQIKEAQSAYAFLASFLDTCQVSLQIGHDSDMKEICTLQEDQVALRYNPGVAAAIIQLKKTIEVRNISCSRLTAKGIRIDVSPRHPDDLKKPNPYVKTIDNKLWIGFRVNAGQYSSDASGLTEASMYDALLGNTSNSVGTSSTNP